MGKNHYIVHFFHSVNGVVLIIILGGNNSKRRSLLNDVICGKPVLTKNL